MPQLFDFFPHRRGLAVDAVMIQLDMRNVHVDAGSAAHLGQFVDGIEDAQALAAHMAGDDPARFEREGLDRVYKLEGLTEDVAMMDALRAELLQTGAVVTHSSWRNVEIMSQGMGKATALRWLADHLGVDLADCMAFGDNDNDMDMLRAVGWPVAVGNADESLKRAARIVADDDVNDGVAKTLFQYVLGEDAP